jgi:arginyl-tRNA synthetase
MNLYSHFRDEILGALERLAGAGKLPSGLDMSKVTAEPPRDASHGDVSTNAALVLSKAAGRKPREIAELLLAELKGHAEVEAADIAGPGFINLRLKPGFWRARLAEIIGEGDAYGASKIGQGRAINVEYVSANPTGPMHVGHCRGAVVGDALAALYAKTGFKVTREYYINDAGAQVDQLARSVHLRYREALGETIGAIPEGSLSGRLSEAGRQGAGRSRRPQVASQLRRGMACAGSRIRDRRDDGADPRGPRAARRAPRRVHIRAPRYCRKGARK